MSTLTKKYGNLRISLELFEQLKEAAADSGITLRHYVENLIQKAMPKSHAPEVMTPEIEALVEEAVENSRKGNGRRFDDLESMKAWLNSL